MSVLGKSDLTRSDSQGQEEAIRSICIQNRNTRFQAPDHEFQVQPGGVLCSFYRAKRTKNTILSDFQNCINLND